MLLVVGCVFYDIELLLIMMVMLDVIKHSNVVFYQSIDGLIDWRNESIHAIYVIGVGISSIRCLLLQRYFWGDFIPNFK